MFKLIEKMFKEVNSGSLKYLGEKFLFKILHKEDVFQKILELFTDSNNFIYGIFFLIHYSKLHIREEPIEILLNKFEDIIKSDIIYNYIHCLNPILIITIISSFFYKMSKKDYYVNLRFKIIFKNF